jgi:hypothetical protein
MVRRGSSVRVRHWALLLCRGLSSRPGRGRGPEVPNGYAPRGADVPSHHLKLDGGGGQFAGSRLLSSEMTDQPRQGVPASGGGGGARGLVEARDLSGDRARRAAGGASVLALAHSSGRAPRAWQSAVRPRPARGCRRVRRRRRRRAAQRARLLRVAARERSRRPLTYRRSRPRPHTNARAAERAYPLRLRKRTRIGHPSLRSGVVHQDSEVSDGAV